jgi:hypothetical protein
MSISLHSWLRRPPTPVSLRLDGKKSIIIGDGKTKWKDALDAIEAMSPGLIEALNADGHVLRVTQLEQENEAPAGMAPLDPGSSNSRDVEIARLLLEAGDRAAARHEAAYLLGFNKLAELVTSVMQRNSDVEKAWQDQQRQLVEAASGNGGDEAGGMIGQLLQLAVTKKAEGTKK